MTIDQLLDEREAAAARWNENPTAANWRIWKEANDRYNAVLNAHDD